MANSVSTLLSSLWALLCAAGLMALAGGLGAVVLARMGPLPSSRWERYVLAAGLGLGLLSYLGFALGALALLRPMGVRIALLLCAVAAVSAFLRSRRTLSAADLPAEANGEEMPVWVRALLLVAGLYLLCVLAACLTPMLDYDGLTYHVAAPKRWLELGAMRSLPTHLMTEWPMGFEMIYMLLLPLAGVSACKPMLMMTAVLAAGAIYAAGARLANRAVGGTAAALFVLGAGADKINTTSIDIALTLFLALSILALVVWQQTQRELQRRRWLLLAAGLAGLGNCVKLNGLLLTGLLTLAVVLINRPAGARPSERFREGALFLGTALLCAAPWYLRAWVHTGNPIYPFAYTLLGGRDWNARAAALLSTYLHYFNLPGTTLAARQAVLWRLLLKLATVIVLSLFLPGPRWTRGFVLAAGGFALLQIAASDQMRYLLPVLPCVALVAAWWAVRIAARAPALGWAGVAGAMMLVWPPALKQAVASLPVLTGAVPREVWVHRYLEHYAVCLWANQALPADARVLIGPDTRAYYLERESYWSHALFQQQIVYTTPESFASSLRQRGITHFLFTPALFEVPELKFEIQVGWRANERLRLEALAAASTLLWEQDGVRIYRLPDSVLR